MYEQSTASLRSALTAERERAKAGAAALKRVSEMEAEEKKRQEAEMTEQQRLQAALDAASIEREQLAASLKAERIRHAILVAASKEFQDPEDAVLLIDRSGIQISDDGVVTGVDEALKALLKKKPHLVKQAAPQAPEIDAARRSSSNGAVTSDELIARKRKDYSGL
jgi:PAS domain-containing protein